MSSFLWRGVLPYVEASDRRLIEPDLIGMGDSDKIPAGAESDRYRFASHARYLDAFIDEVVGIAPLTLVVHDWGGALGFDWAYRHQQHVRAIAYTETLVAPLTLEDLPESFRPTPKAVRSSAGEALVLDQNLFIEKMLPGVTQRALSADEMAEYRRPFLKTGDDRWPTLQSPREVPLSGEPADVHDRIAAYSAWLKTAPSQSSLSTWRLAYSSRAASGHSRAAFLASTALSSEVSTSCKRTIPMRLDGRSRAGSNGFDWPR
jgi:haloalkane dehalogenase